MVIVKKLLIIAALVGVVLWAVPEASVEGQIGYQVTEAQLAAAFPLTTNTVLSTDNTTLAFGTDSDAVVSWQTAGTYLLWNITQAGGSLIAWQDSGASVVLSLSDVSSTVGYDILDLASNLGTMNGSDTVRGLFVDLTNADHTGSSNVLNGIDIDGITGDADATESAIFVGDGWDYDIQFDNGTGTAYVTWGAGGTLQFNELGSSTVLILTDVGYSAGGGKIGLDLNLAPGIANGSDTMRGLQVDITNADHTGASNLLYGIDIDGITGDADAYESAINLGTGWDMHLTFYETGQTPEENPPAGAVGMFLDDNADYSGGGGNDCVLAVIDASGNITILATVTSNGACP